MKSTFITILMLCAQLCMAQNNLLWLKKNVVPFSPDPVLSEKNDVSQLKKYIGNAQIVMLGEETHGDGTAFKTKVELVKFLHKEMGFDVLAWEGGLYQAEKSWDLITNRQGDPIHELKKSAFPLWCWSKEVMPLFEYISNSIKTSNPLKITGFDCQLGSEHDYENFPRDLLMYFRKNNLSFSNQSDQNVFFLFYNYLNGEWKKELQRRDASNKVLFLDSLKHLAKSFERILPEATMKLKAKSDAQGMLLYRQLYSIQTYLPALLQKMGIENAFNPVKATILRDSIMAQNLIWLNRTMYPGKKIIVWAASSHIARNARIEMDGIVIPRMGDFLKNENIYTIGFTAYQGTWASVFMKSSVPINLPNENSFEDFFNKINVPDFFLDLKRLSTTKEGKWLNETKEMRPFGYASNIRSWPAVFDAIIFNKTMEPATLISKQQ